MGNVISFSIFNLALASLRMHFFFKPPYNLLLSLKDIATSIMEDVSCCDTLIVVMTTMAMEARVRQLFILIVMTR